MIRDAIALPLDPALKWAGGKRWLLPVLRDLYAPHRHRRLVEPFVGAMSVALGLRPSTALLADVNPHLVNFYTRLIRSERPFALEMVNESEAYYACRTRFNALVSLPGGAWTDDAAELFYYLNRTCFNGLSRFNKSGGFNVPFGKYKKITYRTDFSEYAWPLRTWQIRCSDFVDLAIEPGDFVYIDPPYDGTFDDYSAGGFSWEKQVLLAERFATHPGPIVASNQATERIIALYMRLGYEIAYLNAPRQIAASGNRDTAREILAVRNISLDLVRENEVFVSKKVDTGDRSGLIVSASSQSQQQVEDANAGGSAEESESEVSQTTLQQIEQGEEEMAYLPEGYAEDIAKAETWERSERCRDGEYVFEHLATKYEKTQKGPALIIEHRVVSSKKVKPDVEPNAPGSKVAYFMPDYGDAAVMLKTNMKNYVCGMIGRDPKKVDDKDPEFVKTIKLIGQERQLARGMYIKGVTFHTTKDDGGDFLGLNWSAMPGENVPDAPTVLARRKALDEEDAKSSSATPATNGAVQGAPAIPPQIPPAVPGKPWLGDGWQAHPTPGWYWKGSDAKSEADLAVMYAGR